MTGTQYRVHLVGIHWAAWTSAWPEENPALRCAERRCPWHRAYWSL